MHTADALAPEPHTFAGTASPLADPQPFARAGDVLVFQALLDEAERIRAGLAAVAARQGHLDGQATYVQALLSGYADPRQIDLRRLTEIRADARLARSNAEAIVERMLAEPASRASIAPRAAVGLLAALRRHALAALALHAGLERGVHEPVQGMAPLAAEMTASLELLAGAVRAGTAPPPLPALRQTQLALPPTDALVGEETDLMVDSINTVAGLLATGTPR